MTRLYLLSSNRHNGHFKRTILTSIKSQSLTSPLSCEDHRHKLVHLEHMLQTQEIDVAGGAGMK